VVGEVDQWLGDETVMVAGDLEEAARQLHHHAHL